MGKKKKTYVKPEMKIIEVKTEGVIAASGGEIIVPPEKIEAFCKNSEFSAAGFSHSKAEGGNKQNCENMVNGIEYAGYHKWAGCDVHFWYSSDGTTFYYRKCDGGC